MIRQQGIRIGNVHSSGEVKSHLQYATPEKPLLHTNLKVSVKIYARNL